MVVVVKSRGTSSFQKQQKARVAKQRAEQERRIKARQERRRRQRIEKVLFEKGIPFKAELKGGVGAEQITTKFIVIDGKRINLEETRRQTRPRQRQTQRLPTLKPDSVIASDEIQQFASSQKVPFRQITREGIRTPTRVSGKQVTIKTEDIQRAKRLSRSSAIKEKDVNKLARSVAISRTRKEASEAEAIRKSKETLARLKSFNTKVDDKVRKTVKDVFTFLEKPRDPLQRDVGKRGVAIAPGVSVPGTLAARTTPEREEFTKRTVEETSVLLNQVFNPLVFGTNIGGGLAAISPLAEEGLTTQALKKGVGKSFELAGKGFQKAKTLKPEDVKKATISAEKKLIGLAKRVKDGDFTTPENFAIGLTLFAAFRPDKLLGKGAKKLISSSSKAVKDVNVKKALSKFAEVNKGLLKSKAGKARLPSSTKKSKRIIKQIKKKPTKAAIRKKVQKAKLEQPIPVKPKDVEPIRAFSIKQKGDFLRGVELGKGKSKTRTTVRVKTKARKVVTKVVETGVPVGGGQIAKKLLKVKQVQKFERITKPSLKLSQKQSQRLQTTLGGTKPEKTKVLKKILSKSKEEQAKTFATTQAGVPKGFRSQKVKDALLKKVNAQIKNLESKEKSLTRKFVKNLNQKIKKFKSSKEQNILLKLSKQVPTISKKKKFKKLPKKRERKVLKEKSIPKQKIVLNEKEILSIDFLNIVANNQKVFGKLSNSAKNIIDSKRAVKGANDVGRKIRALSLIRFKREVLPVSRVSPKTGASPKPKTISKGVFKPSVATKKKIGAVVTPKKKKPRKPSVTTPPKPVKTITKVPKVPKKPLKPKQPKKPVKRRKLIKVTKTKPFKKIKPKKKKAEQIIKKAVKKKTKQVTSFTPTLLRPTKQKIKVDGEDLIFFTGLEKR